MYWRALKEHLESDGWVESRQEPALFYLRERERLKGILVTHVDDIEGGVQPGCLDTAFRKSASALEFATNHFKAFVFRGREAKQIKAGHIDVSMRNYATSMKQVKLSRDRRKQLESELTSEEQGQLESIAGELGWTTRQLRCDLSSEHGVIQRRKKDACVGDLVRLNQNVGQVRRGAALWMRFRSDVDLRKAVIMHLADSGHANGTPEKNKQVRHRSVGGYFILAANLEILEGKEARCNILSYHSGQTKRVCGSTLAAEASHLAEAVEAGEDHGTVGEALTRKVDLKNWSHVIERRQRTYVTDAKSVFDYLQRDAMSTSTDKRMAIEGALLRETAKKPRASVRWIDGMQNIADVLTKSGVEKAALHEFLRTGTLSLTQTQQNRQLKERKKLERQKRNQVRSEEKESKKQLQSAERRRTLAAELGAEEDSDGSERTPKKNTAV